MVVTEHCNNIARRGIFTKLGAWWTGKVISGMMARHAKGECSLFSVQFKDAWSKIYIRLKRNCGGRFFQLELLAEDCTYEDVILFIQEEKNGEGWREFAEAIIEFVEEGPSKG